MKEVSKKFGREKYDNILCYKNNLQHFAGSIYLIN